MTIGQTEQGADPEAGVGGKYNINVLSRAIRVLRCFTLDAPNLTLTEVAARAELSLPTTLRILSTLRSHGLILRDPRTELFSLGYEFLPMAEIVRSGDGLLALAKPVMARLRDLVNETVILAVVEGDIRRNVFQYESSHEMRRIVTMGATWPHYVGAGGKAILAQMSDPALESYLNRTELRPFTEFTIATPQGLRHEIGKIRRTGYAESEQEQAVSGAHSFSCAITGPRGQSVASLSVSLPIFRLTAAVRDRIVSSLKEAADSLSSQLRSG